MTQSEKLLSTFQTRVRQMILRFQELKKEKADLYAMMEEKEQRIKELEEQLAQMQKDYESLKMARMITIIDKDLDGAKERVARMIRDVNKCIAVLSDEK
ncbi:MAG: hypothetical protein IJ887_04540 [Prevotella sp.]|nr:hypothetical protein [Prevotella sp.]MBR6188955.1 hypothetical protein [Prevotella sp.]